MSNYSKVTDFAAKDALSTGNPAKIVKGTEIDDELVAISGAIASKADLASPTFTGTPAAPTASAGTNTTQVATTAFANAAAAAVMPTGALVQWSTASAPSGFLLCNGAAVSRTIYSALFAVIGTTFGAGDGTTTFTLPDLKNRFPVGAGDLYSLAATGGSKDAVVVSHSHTVTDPGHDHSYTRYNALQVQSGSATQCWTGTSTQNTSSETTGITIDSAGESGTNKNLPPYLALYFIIKT